MLGPGQLRYVVAGVVLMTMQPLLVTLSQSEAGRLEYSPVCATLLSEILKICLSAGMLQLDRGSRKPLRLEARALLRYSVPAAIYFVNNNLVFIILESVNPTTFQMLSQLKIVFTGLLFRVFLGRKLNPTQYLAIWQLTCGTATLHIPVCSKVGGARDHDSSSFGLLLSVVSCLLSAMGGIYSEKLLKESAKDSIHWQNIQLYSWGIAFNFFGAVWHDGKALRQGPFHGFNFWAYVVVLNNSLNGLAISAILKYADNIARVYAHAAAMMVTMVVSLVLFGQVPSVQALVAAAIIAASAIQYNLSAEQILGAAVAPSAASSRSLAMVAQSKKETEEELEGTARNV